MTIVAERGLFVRLLVQSGKFESAAAEALVDALDAATREPATKLDLEEVRNELKLELAELRADLKLGDASLRQEIAELRKDLHAQSNQIVLKLGGLLVVLAGLMFAALRLPH